MNKYHEVKNKIYVGIIMSKDVKQKNERINQSTTKSITKIKMLSLSEVKSCTFVDDTSRFGSANWIHFEVEKIVKQKTAISHALIMGGKLSVSATDLWR